MKKALIFGAGLLALTTAPIHAKHHAANDHLEDKKAADANAIALDKVIMADRRKEDAARDKYRNPKETMAFMGVTPEMTVAEYAPGGGWYSRVIAPYIAERGKFIGLQFAPDTLPFDEEAKDRVRGFNVKFPDDAAEWTGMDASKFAGYTVDTIPEEVNGTVDFVFIPRMLHNLLRWHVADSEIKTMRALLKDGGHLGIVQHRAKADAPYSYTDGNKGYLREADVIKLMDVYGFDLVKKSEINANANDNADYEGGVWTLPPRLSTSKDDPEAKAKYEAIGESDRMTLLFKKRP